MRAAIAALTVSLAVCATTVRADRPASTYDTLQQTLEDKFKPTQPAPAPTTAPPAGKQEFQWIRPKPEDGKKGGKQSQAPASPLAGLFAARVGRSTDAGSISTSEAGLLRDGPLRLFRGRYRKAKPEEQQAAQAAEAAIPVAKRNSYVIQLKPTATEAEIKALLRKYNLVVTKIIAPLGVMTVEVASTRGAAPTPAPAAEDTAAEPADVKQKLQSILEPPLIRDLRQEGAVDGAFVNTTMGANVLPRPSAARTTIDGETFAWRWPPGDTIDGNWGLKALRMPAVWTILDRHRKANPGLPRPKIGIVDGGFVASPSVTFASMVGVRPFSFHNAGCDTHHGMHVAGIIGARHGDPASVDGMIPEARLDAIAVDDKLVGNAGVLGVDEGWEVHALLFDDVLAKTLDYVYANLMTPDNLRVINISLGYNFVARHLLGDLSPDDVPGLALHVHHQANLIRLMASRVEDRILFVVAAGNDSDGRDTPIAAKWASPFAWAATQDSSAGERPKNILVVEASDRAGARAPFSNVGGHVAAPGVDIMSTLAGGANAQGVCSGTSQAAPHAAALAAILLELDPSKSPAEVIDILVASATAQSGSKAGVIDALAAVDRLSPLSSRLASDLNGDGRVDAGDLAVFSRQLEAIDAAATQNAPFTEDLNGDGVIDDNECYWPIIDLDGSGAATSVSSDGSRISGRAGSDLDVLAAAWGDETKSFDVALAETSLATRASRILTASLKSTGAGSLPAQCRGLVPTPAAGEQIAQPATRGTVGDGEPATRFATAAIGPASDSAPDPKKVRAEVEAAVETLRKENPKLRVTIDPATGLPSSITGLAPQPGAAGIGATEAGGDLTEAETRRAVESFFGMGALQAALPTENKAARMEYVGRRRDPDFPERYVAQVEQRVNGVAVFGSSARLTVERSLGVTSYKGKSSTVAIASTLPTVAETDAIATARQKLETILRTSPGTARAFPLAPNPRGAEAKAELVVFDPALIQRKKGATRLAWMVTIESFRIFVDANTREAFYHYRDQPSGMLRRIWDLDGSTAFPGKKGIDETTRERQEGLAPEALQAFRNAGIVRDFYFLVFGRDGYDDNDGAGPKGGADLEAYVRYGRTRDAYWCTRKSYDCPAGNVMVYGPGFSSAIDIVGHEMTHGIIAHERNLLYLNEPGAVNESLADIMGTLIEFEYRGAAGNWLIGENAPGFSLTSPLRSMADPNLRDEMGRSMFDRTAKFSLANRGQPDHYGDLLTVDDLQCASTAYQDNGCVHFNSGILNKFAYLVAEGGEHRGIAVRGLGTMKLARLTYRTMTAALNQTSGLMEAAEAFVESCYELAGSGVAGITEADCGEVSAAQRAVGLFVSS